MGKNNKGGKLAAGTCAAALALTLPAAALGVDSAWAAGETGLGRMPASAAFASEAGALSAAEASSLGLTADLAATPIVDWTQWGTCEWSIDSSGCLIVRPANGADEGYVANDVPWVEKKASIVSVRFEGVCNPVRKNNAGYVSCSWFSDCTSLKSIDLTGLNTADVTTMSGMFSGCSSLESLDLSGLDTGHLNNLQGMFEGCSSLVSLDLSGWDTSNVISMINLFDGCTSLATLNLSGWDTSGVADMDDYGGLIGMSNMFNGCSSLRKVYLGEKFSFSGSGSVRMCDLPTPSGDGLTGKWVSSADGLAYLSEDVPSNVASTYVAQRQISDSMFAVNLADVTYTGRAITGRVSSEELVEGSDYEVTYSDNVNAGTAKITITGKGACTGTLSYTFEIKKAKPGDPGVPGLARPCIGGVIFGTTLGGLSLPEGYSWQDDLSTPVGNVGTHTFLATFTPADTANYEVVRDVPVEVGVVAKAIDDSMFKVDTSDATYTGQPVTGRVAAIGLVEGTDYEVSYINNVDAGTAKIVITGKGNYRGTVDYVFRIVAQDTLPDPVQTFPDVDYSQWYADGVSFCSEKGLITGYADGEDAGKFGVGRTLTRAQLAAILWRNAEPEAAGAYDSDAANETGMADVADNEWYTGAANWAVKAKVINGSDKGDHREFCPNDPVTAEQLAAILANYADPAGAESADLGVLDGFADSGAISDWARGSVAWAKSRGIINGYDEGSVRLLKPYEEIARERVATILMNAFESGVLE